MRSNLNSKHKYQEKKSNILIGNDVNGKSADKGRSSGSDFFASKKEGLLWMTIVFFTFLSILICSKFSNMALSLCVICVLVCSVSAAFLFTLTGRGKAFLVFYKAAKNELYKVTWPTREDTVRTTVIISVIVVVVSFLLWSVDSILIWIIGSL